MQNPEERPYVVRTNASCCRARHEALSALALVQLAVAWTEVALDAAVGQCMPPARGVAARVRQVAHASTHFSACSAPREVCGPRLGCKPALSFRWRRNSVAEAISCQTCGRKSRAGFPRSVSRRRRRVAARPAHRPPFPRRSLRTASAGKPRCADHRVPRAAVAGSGIVEGRRTSMARQIEAQHGIGLQSTTQPRSSPCRRRVTKLAMRLDRHAAVCAAGEASGCSSLSIASRATCNSGWPRSGSRKATPRSRPRGNGRRPYRRNCVHRAIPAQGRAGARPAAVR